MYVHENMIHSSILHIGKCQTGDTEETGVKRNHSRCSIKSPLTTVEVLSDSGVLFCFVFFLAVFPVPPSTVPVYS